MCRLAKARRTGRAGACENKSYAKSLKRNLSRHSTYMQSNNGRQSTADKTYILVVIPEEFSLSPLAKRAHAGPTAPSAAKILSPGCLKLKAAIVSTVILFLPRIHLEISDKRNLQVIINCRWVHTLLRRWEKVHLPSRASRTITSTGI